MNGRQELGRNPVYGSNFKNPLLCPFATGLGEKILVEAILSMINWQFAKPVETHSGNFPINFENFFHFVVLQGQMNFQGGHRNVRTQEMP